MIRIGEFKIKKYKKLLQLYENILNLSQLSFHYLFMKSKELYAYKNI